MIFEIECAGCGARRKLSDEKGQYVETLLRQGWDSFRGEIYCPDCMKVGNITLTGRLRPDGSCEAGGDQRAKEDSGKLRLELVPREIIRNIAAVREYGTRKYKDPENWRRVEEERFRNAAFRHFLAFLDEPEGADEESGLPHLWHLACNIAFLCEKEKERGTWTGKMKAEAEDDGK